MNQPTSSPEAKTEDARIAPNPGATEVFLTFLTIGLMGFGGLAPAATHMIVEKKKWYTAKDFVELFALCAIIPGGNILNASIIIGYRFQGALGSFLAISGLMLAPLAILVLLAVTYDSFSHLPDVRAATAGAASAAAGLIVGTAGKLIRGVEKSWTSLVFGVLTFAAVGILRFPLQATLLTMVPLAVAWAFFRARGSRSAR